MTIKEINENISKNLDFICLKKKMDKSEFIKDLINHFSSANASMKIGKEIIYQMVNGGRKNNRNEDPVPVSFGIDRIHAVCEYLGVSLDGLIGDNKPLSSDIDLQAVCKYLRLDEEAVETLRDRPVLSLKRHEETSNSILNNLLIEFLPGLHSGFLTYWNYCEKEAGILKRIKNEFKEAKERITKYEYTDENGIKEDASTCMRLYDEFHTAIGARRGLLYDVPTVTLKYTSKALNVSGLIESEEEVSELIDGWFDHVILLEGEGERDGEHNEDK